jgi:GT2 family glycosyltransferase
LNTDQPKVVCVILNWNGWQDTVACLDALRQANYTNLTTIVVDNGSTNDSVERIQAAHPEILLLATGGNLGFAAGNNHGIRYGLEHGAEYIWLLNNDTKPAPDALSALVRKAEADPALGEVGSVLRYMDRPEVVQAWGGGRVNTWIGYSWRADKLIEDEWFHDLLGASILIRGRALEQVGLLDERFFLYWEDSEFGFRLRKFGWKLGVAADSNVLHKVNASTAGNRPLLDRYFTASGILFLRLYSPFPLFSIPVFLALRVGKRIVHGKFQNLRAVALGVSDYLVRRRTHFEL